MFLYSRKEINYLNNKSSFFFFFLVSALCPIVPFFFFCLIKCESRVATLLTKSNEVWFWLQIILAKNWPFRQDELWESWWGGTLAISYVCDFMQNTKICHHLFAFYRYRGSCTKPDNKKRFLRHIKLTRLRK